MSHLDEGAVLSLRDGDLLDADARLHAEGCAVCASALSDARIRADDVSRLLRSLDFEGTVDVEAGKRDVRRRLDQRRESAHRRRPVLASALGRAAILLLAAAGVAYAVPGSPLRDWVQRVTSDEATPTPAEAAAPTGVEVAVPAEGLRITLTPAGPGQLVEVRRTRGPRVSIVAAAGSRYSVGDGRAGVVLEPGPVVIGIPDTGAPVTIEADGRMLLRRADGLLDLPGEVVSRSDDVIVLSTGGA